MNNKFIKIGLNSVFNKDNVENYRSKSGLEISNVIKLIGDCIRSKSSFIENGHWFE